MTREMPYIQQGMKAIIRSMTKAMTGRTQNEWRKRIRLETGFFMEIKG